MSATEQELTSPPFPPPVVPVAPVEAPAGSLSSRIAARRAERDRKRKELLTIPVNGYEDLFAAIYRRLPFEERGDVAKKHPGIGDDTTDEVGAAADTLINACQDVLEVVGKDEQGKPMYQSLGKRWTSSSIAELFELELAPKTTARQAMLTAFDSDDLMDHFLEYVRQMGLIDAQDTEELPGESEPSVEG